MESEHLQHAKVFKAFCDENRLVILQLLCGGEKCACKLQNVLSIGQSTLSHHMKILCESGIVTARKEGKWTYYAIALEAQELGQQLIAQYTAVTDSAQDTDCRE
jgi:ArsR family transcriptional regulator, arsenate/arsenite/antimonite-responsive transcriptional repressor